MVDFGSILKHPILSSYMEYLSKISIVLSGNIADYQHFSNKLQLNLYATSMYKFTKLSSIGYVGISSPTWSVFIK